MQRRKPTPAEEVMHTLAQFCILCNSVNVALANQLASMAQQSIGRVASFRSRFEELSGFVQGHADFDRRQALAVTEVLTDLCRLCEKAAMAGDPEEMCVILGAIGKLSANARRAVRKQAASASEPNRRIFVSSDFEGRHGASGSD